MASYAELAETLRAARADNPRFRALQETRRREAEEERERRRLEELTFLAREEEAEEALNRAATARFAADEILDSRLRGRNFAGRGQRAGRVLRELLEEAERIRDAYLDFRGVADNLSPERYRFLEEEGRYEEKFREMVIDLGAQLREALETTRGLSSEEPSDLVGRIFAALQEAGAPPVEIRVEDLDLATVRTVAAALRETGEPDVVGSLSLAFGLPERVIEDILAERNSRSPVRAPSPPYEENPEEQEAILAYYESMRERGE